MLHFSRGLFGLSLFNLIFMRTDVFVLGKLYPAEQLGLYAMAVYLVQTPVAFLINLMSQTLLPTFSGIQGDHDRINRILIKVTSVVVLMGIPLLVFAAFSGRHVLEVVYGKKYGAGALALTFAACAAFFNVLNNQITMIFYAKGVPRLHRRCVMAMAAVVVLLTYPLSKHLGLWGAQLACLIAILVGFSLQIERIPKITGLEFPSFRPSFVVSASVSCVAAAAWIGVKSAGLLVKPAPNIAFGVLVYVISCVAAGFILFRMSSGLSGRQQLNAFEN